jgi:hypothetical protein
MFFPVMALGVLMMAVMSSPTPLPTPVDGAHCRRSVQEQRLEPALLQPISLVPLLVLSSLPVPPCKGGLLPFNYLAALPLPIDESST